MQHLIPQPGIKPRPPALGARSLTHWTTREVPEVLNFNELQFISLFVFDQCVLCLFLKSLSTPRLWKSLYFLLEAFIFYLLQLGL